MRAYTSLTPPPSAPTTAWPSIKTSAWGLISFVILLEGVRIQEYFSPFTAGILELKRVIVKLFGLHASMAMIGVCCFLYHEYAGMFFLGRIRYARFMKFLQTRVAVA